MEWIKYKLSDFMDFNPTTPLKKNTEAKKVAMENLGINSKKVLGWTTAKWKLVMNLCREKNKS